MRKRTFILCLVISFFTSRIFSQTEFEHISSLQGLSSDRVLDIIQDKDGFYWIATSEGLNRFDGSTFKVYRHDKNDSTSISHNNCCSLFEDESGDIWIGTIYGLNRFVKKTGTFKRYYFHHPGYTDNSLNRVFDFAKDNEGNIWVAAFGLWKIDPHTDKVTSYFFDKSNNASISDPSQLHTILFDKSRNGLWVLTSQHLNFFSVKTGQFFNYKNNPLRWQVFLDKINTGPFIALDENGGVWTYVYSKGELNFYKPASNDYISRVILLNNDVAGLLIDETGNPIFTMELQHAVVYNTISNKIDTLRYIADWNIQKVNYKLNRYYRDRQKNIWLCTLNGLFVSKNPEKKHRVFLLGESEYQLPKSINGLVIRQGDAFLGIQNKIYKYNLFDKQQKQVFYYPSPHELRPMLNEGDSLLWAAAEEKLIAFNFKTGNIQSEVTIPGGPYFLMKGDKSLFWIGTWLNGLYQIDRKGKILNHFTTENGLTDNSLISGCMSTTGEIWIGFNGGKGFARFEPRTQKFENFLIHSDKKSPETNIINAILPDSLGNIWLGTYGGGLYYFDRKRNSFKNYQVQDGLSGDYINTLAFDNNGNLWISTSNGIDILNRSGVFYHIEERMKLNNNDHLYNLSKAGADSFFYFAANKLLFTRPDLYSEATSNANILISDFKVHNKELPEPYAIKKISLPFNKNFFSIVFSVLKVSPSIPANYRYRLEGFDKNWIDAGNRGVATYTNVPPGKYTLLLDATDETGRWKQEPLSIRITITPPFWKTWWFILLSLLAISGSLYWFYRYRITQLRKVYMLRSKISQDLHDEVASTLSGIRLYSELAKQQLGINDALQVQRSLNIISDNASEMKDDMSDIIWAINPANDSFKKLLLKLKSYATELAIATGMKFYYSADEQIPEEKLNMQQRRNVYLICKEAINNAVKYSAGENLNLFVERKNQHIKIIIQDNGKGFDQSEKKEGNGLLNMQARAKEISADLKIAPVQGKGTKVELVIGL